jgi:hypothetical protein
VQFTQALEPVTDGSGKLSIAHQLTNLRNDRRLYLVIKEVNAKQPPETLYHVYLNLQRDKKIGSEENQSVGSFNFYASYGAPRPDFFFSYDVTETLRKLQARGLLSEPLMVTLIPANEPASDSRATIGQIQLVEQ